MRSESTRFLRFVVAGGLSAVVNVTVRYLLTPVVGYQPSIIIAYLIGMLIAWQLARRYVFEPSIHSRRGELLRFSIVNLFGVVQVWAISVLLDTYGFPAIGFTWHARDIAHVIGVGTPAFTSYLGHRHFSFSQAR